MAIQQRAGFAEKGEKIFAHSRESEGGTPAGPTGKMPVLQLTGGVIRRLCSLLRDSDHFNFYVRTFR
jgi:hypothetical protein